MRKILYFTAEKTLEVRTEPLEALGAGKLMVETILSAISPGTEMMVYRGKFPDVMADVSIDHLKKGFEYPIAYGYACVGRVSAVGDGVSPDWLGRLVFAFQPHCSHFLASPEAVLPVPDQFSVETACFLANCETAVNLVQDAAPLLGERVLVFGQGIVGLLTASLLAEFPIDNLVCVDKYSLRRRAGLNLGATAVLDPSSTEFVSQARACLGSGADLAIELSGSPAALDAAISLTAFSGRVIVGSWYSDNCSKLDLGSTFHRSRIKLISSQVSTISPELSSRWDKKRRFDVTWYVLKRLRPEKWITHTFQIDEAEQAYQLLDQRPGEAIQVVFKYSL